MSFPGVGLGNTVFPGVSGVNIGAFHAILGSKSPMVNLRSPRVQPGSNFHIWVQNPMGVLTTNFHPYPVNTSQVISFLRSIITFPGKKLLTPEGVTGGVSITRGLFSGSVSYVRNKIDMPSLIISRKLPTSGQRGCFSKCY